MTTVRRLELLTSAQRSDLSRMTDQMRRRLEELHAADSEFRRREAGEWVLRVAAELYAWSR